LKISIAKHLVYSIKKYLNDNIFCFLLSSVASCILHCKHIRKGLHVKYYKFLLYTEIKLKKVLVNDLNIFISLSEAEKIDFEMVINEYSIFRELYEAFKEYNFCMKPLLETFKVLVSQHISETEKFYKFTEFERNYLLLGIRK